MGVNKDFITSNTCTSCGIRLMLYRSSFLESCVLISSSYDDNAPSSSNLATTLPRLPYLLIL